MRWLIATTCVLAACSGAASEPALPDGPLVGVGEATSDSPPAESRTGTSVPSGAEVEQESVGPGVSITVDSPRGAAMIEGLVAEAIDPFGQFVSCSGVRSNFGVYSILGSGGDGPVSAIGVSTDMPVARPGVHAAVVRVEYAVGAPLVASGSMTIDDGFTNGEFTGIDADGAVVNGTFQCDGGPGTEPLVVGADDGVLEVVEVFALLRAGEAERLVGFVAQPAGGTSVECAGAQGGESPTVVRVDGDSSVGSMTTFELTNGDRPTMRFRVGATSFEFDQLVEIASNTPTAGVFSAVADGISVDGAYRCS